MSKIYDKNLKYRGSEDSFDMRPRVFEDPIQEPQRENLLGVTRPGPEREGPEKPEPGERLQESRMVVEKPRDRQFSVKLRAKRVINTPREPPITPGNKGPLEKGVFERIPYDSKGIGGQRVFGSRLVNEAKGIGTATPDKSSRLVTLAFSNEPEGYRARYDRALYLLSRPLFGQIICLYRRALRYKRGLQFPD